MLKNGIDALSLYGVRVCEGIVARVWALRWHELVPLRLWGLRIHEDVLRAPGVVKAAALRVQGLVAREALRVFRML